MPSVRLTLAIFAAGNALLGFAVYHEYRSLASYCDGSPEVAAGGDKFSCLEPQHWFSIEFEAFVLLILWIASAVTLGAAIVHDRNPDRLDRTRNGRSPDLPRVH
jgi:hypothetical protein